MKTEWDIRLAKLVGLGGLATTLLGTALPAHAVPSYARQTGEDCAACHVGSFGPQLTPYGRRFKLGGYTDTNGGDGNIPLSAMLVQSFTHTSKDQSADPGKGFDTNNNLSLQEVSVFLAGRLTDNIGTFAQVTHAEPDRSTSMDNMDLRFVKPVELAGKETLLGISINNNPTLQDGFNSASAWRFPYTSSELTPGYAATPLIDGGLAIASLGATAYAFHDNHWYGELGGYQSLSNSTLDKLNVETGDKIDGTAAYWRLAYTDNPGTSDYHLGLFGLHANLLPGGQNGPTDDYNDIGIDGSYTFLGTQRHVATLNGSYTHEKRDLNASFAAGDAARSDGDLNRLDLSASYYFDKTYGFTLGLFDIDGNSDNALYNSGEADTGSIKGSPNTRGYTLQADWTPFGKSYSWGEPNVNLRLGLQYTGYSKFNGADSNYDGLGRDAGDNNTLYGFAWLAF